MIIRTETKEDFPTVYSLVQIAFATAKVKDGDEQDYVDTLRAGDGYIPELALVLEDEGELIGHIMFTGTTIQTLKGTVETLLLSPLCTKIERRNQGLGGLLIKEGFRKAKEIGYSSVVLVGDPQYYSRFGFGDSSLLGIENTNGIPSKNVMCYELVPDSLSNCEGSITFIT